MTKAQRATIRKEMAAFTFDTSDYLRLSVMTSSDADKRKTSAKQKSASSTRTKSKKK
jgi:hypothetical protein